MTKTTEETARSTIDGTELVRLATTNNNWKSSLDNIFGGMIGTSNLLPFLNVLDFGADPTGTNDSATAINNAIAALPVNGGDVVFPNGLYKVNSTINIGNGSTTAGSTRYGVRLRGVGVPKGEWFGGTPPGEASSSVLTWGGASNGTVVQVNGPLMGWGLENIYIDGALFGNCLYGVRVISGSWGNCQNLSIEGTNVACLSLESVASFSGDESKNSPLSAHNSFYNSRLLPSTTTYAKGLLLTGSSVGNACFNQFYNTMVLTPGTSNTTYAVYLQVCDTNRFYGLQIQPGGTGWNGIVTDYGTNDYFPNSNSFYNIELGNTATPFLLGGTPNATSANQPNEVYGVSLTNGTVPPANYLGWCFYAATGQKTLLCAVSDLGSASAANKGTRRIVSDANATTFASVVAQGGSNVVPVYSDGSNWRIG